MESIVLLLAVAMFGQVANRGDGADVPSSTVDVPSEPEKVSITQMIRSFAPLSDEGQLAGVRMTLAEVAALSEVTGINLNEGPSRRAVQTGRVEAYWDLFAATALFHLANRHELELQTLREGIVEPGPLWKQAETQSQQSTQLARQRARSAQFHLQQLLGPSMSGQSNGDLLPRCAELPHCGRYNSRYDAIFEDRPSPVAKQLHELLDSEYLDLVAQSKAITKSTERLHQLSISRRPESDGTELLSAYQHLVLQRTHFVEAVRRYNQSIVRYVLFAAPKPIDTDRLVAMLIYQPPSNREAGQPERPIVDDVRQPAGEPDEGPIKTFAEPPSEGGRGSWTQPRKSDAPAGERSILVAPVTGAQQAG